MTTTLANLVDTIETSKARYARNSISAYIIRCRDNGGFKTDADFLLENLKGRYSNREKCYILPASKQQKLDALLPLIGMESWQRTIEQHWMFRFDPLHSTKGMKPHDDEHFMKFWLSDVKRAIEQGQPVPQDVLNDYSKYSSNP